MQRSAEALSHAGIPQHSDTQETVRKMAAMKTELVNPAPPCHLFSCAVCFVLMFCCLCILRTSTYMCTYSMRALVSSGTVFV